MTQTAELQALVERAEADPGSVAAARDRGDELADASEDDLALRWRVCVVRSVMADPPDGDAVRELYGALVDRYRDEPERLALLRPLGAQIRALEADGTLASAMVARTRRR